MVLNWKYVFLVGLQSLLAQETVVEAFEEDSLGLSLVGVVPLSDYQKALADVAEVRSGLEIELRATRAVFEVKEGSWKNQLLTLKGERDEALSKVQELELALAASHQTWMQALQQWHGKVDDAMTSVRVPSKQFRDGKKRWRKSRL